MDIEGGNYEDRLNFVKNVLFESMYIFFNGCDINNICDLNDRVVYIVYDKDNDDINYVSKITDKMKDRYIKLLKIDKNTFSEFIGSNVDSMKMMDIENTYTFFLTEFIKGCFGNETSYTLMVDLGFESDVMDNIYDKILHNEYYIDDIVKYYNDRIKERIKYLLEQGNLFLILINGDKVYNNTELIDWFINKYLDYFGKDDNFNKFFSLLEK